MSDYGDNNLVDWHPTEFEKRTEQWAKTEMDKIKKEMEKFLY